MPGPYVEISIRENYRFPPYKEKPWLMDLNSHGLIIGKTGTGKSNYLRLILDHLDGEKCNIILLDPHGEVSDYALMKTKKNSVFLSGKDYEGSEGIYTGLNVLQYPGDEASANLMGDWVKQAFSLDDALSRGTWGPRLETVFAGLLIKLVQYEKGLTLEGFAGILPDRKRVMSYFPSAYPSPVNSLIRLNAANSRQWSDFIMSTMNKLVPVLANPITRRFISMESESAVDLDSALLGTGNLIIPELNLGMIGESAVRIISTLLLFRVWSTLTRRGPSDEKTYILVDEAHMIPESILKIMLAEGRKYGITLILMYQSISQNTKKFSGILLSNIRNYTCFSLSREDAELLAGNLGNSRNIEHLTEVLMNQPRHRATVSSDSDMEAAAYARTGNDRYGPVTVNIPFQESDYSSSGLETVKSDLIRKTGHPETRALDPHNIEKEPHNRLIFLFADFLESHGIPVRIEPDLGGIIPDLLLKYNDEEIYCEVEYSDLEQHGKIAGKLFDYEDSRLMFICNSKDFGRLVSVIAKIVEKTSLNLYYFNQKSKVPRWVLPASLLKTYIVVYEAPEFKYFNGTELVRFQPKFLEREGCFIERARKLPLGSLRESVLRDVAAMIKEKGEADLDVLEEKYGRTKLRNLLQSITERGYGNPMNLNSLLELDKIVT